VFEAALKLDNRRVVSRNRLEGGVALTPENLIADGDFVAMQARGKSTTKTGKPYNNTSRS
jgi:ketosteroid isomerase-like protein